MSHARHQQPRALLGRGAAADQACQARQSPSRWQPPFWAGVGWPRLAEHAHLVAIDLPGVGHSQRRDALLSPRPMSEFVLAADAFGLERPHLIAAGTGTAAALFAAARCPGRLRSLVVGSAAAVPLLGGTLREWVEAPDLKTFRRADPQQIVAGTLASMKRSVTPEAVPDDYLSSYRGNRYAESVRYVRAYPTDLPVLADLLPQIPTPVLIIAGTRDTTVPPANAEFMARRLPRSTPGILDAGHFTWEDASDEYAALVISWWSGDHRDLTSPTTRTPGLPPGRLPAPEQLPAHRLPDQPKETPMSFTTDASTDTTVVRPFTVPATSEAELEALSARITATRWPDSELVPDFSQGVQQAVMQELARYWATEYDLRRFERRLSALPNFVTEIDGLDIHFIDVRSPHENALPIIVTHGWPGSVIELLNIIDPLTNPTAHGGTAADAFDVVIPSMPGFGFSGKPRDLGWGPVRIAHAWDALMKRLGYTRYVAQGGDWGAIITDLMGVQAPAGLLGIHTNMAGAVPADVWTVLVRNVLGAGGPPPPGLSEEESRTFEQLNEFFTKGVGYGVLMGTRPQTMFSLADSPVSLAAWLLNHDASSYQDIAAAFAGRPVGNLTRDEVLDNITLYWLTNTGVSSARIYWENTVGFFDIKGVTVPAAVSTFPHEIYQVPRSWAERAYPNLIYFNALDRGNHFAAWQEPELFSAELRAAFQSLR